VNEPVDLRSVEQALTTYYDQEATDRAGRALEEERVTARTRFIGMLGSRRPRLLEVGPGTGRDSAAFVGAGFPVTGVDLSHEQLVHARSLGLLATVATARCMPFADATFDALWSMSTLMHVPDSAIEVALGELRRVLAPGAMVGIGVWGGPDVETTGAEDRFDPPRSFSRRSDLRWRALLTALGTVEVFDNWHPDRDDFWYQWAVVRRS
jgi:SAM-dependent methyltransferase